MVVQGWLRWLGGGEARRILVVLRMRLVLKKSVVVQRWMVAGLLVVG